MNLKEFHTIAKHTPDYHKFVEIIQDELQSGDVRIYAGKEKVNYSDIIGIVSRQTDVSEKDILGRSRIMHIKESRFILCYILRIGYGQGFKQIADYLGKDHASVMHACRSVDNWLQTDRSFKMKYENIKTILNTFKQS